tara:strand:+ start:1109 stop:1324 length:216 start_codon:yes stop_codon:yes gene_type:complete
VLALFKGIPTCFDLRQHFEAIFFGASAIQKKKGEQWTNQLWHFFTNTVSEGRYFLRACFLPFAQVQSDGII